jgi:hypothetical protein
MHLRTKIIGKRQVYGINIISVIKLIRHTQMCEVRTKI